MPPDPEHERAKILLPAMARALGRIRYLAERDPVITDVLDTMDRAIAESISIPVDRVPEATSTAKSPTESERAVDALLSRALLVRPEDLTAGLREYPDTSDRRDGVVNPAVTTIVVSSDGAERSGAPYQMRPLTTDADWTAAGALITDRTIALRLRGIEARAFYMAALQDRNSPRTVIGLVEDEQLRACLILEQSVLQPGDESALDITHVCIAPLPASDRVGHLLTLWAADYAARSGAMTVRASIPAIDDASVERLLAHATGLGWINVGKGVDKDGNRVIRLRLGAQAYNGLSAMVRCTVPRQGLEGEARELC
ncbi:hypothetical protein [Streptomyces sp. NPDC047525]|uniref:hypothetical protein n=1 Tax=Streptomyces sp. NPDC047525 TaxID=3155264 RepID=UPI0033FD1C96